MRIEVEVTEDGRIVAPPGVRLRVFAEIVSEEDSKGNSNGKSQLQALWDNINSDADSIVLKFWPVGDPIVEKYRRKELID